MTPWWLPPLLAACSMFPAHTYAQLAPPAPAAVPDALSTVLPGTPPAQAASPLIPPEPLTLAQALARASAGSFFLSAAARDIDIAEGEAIQAATRPNPEVGTSMEDTRSSSRITTAQIGLPIELGGKRAARMTAADASRDLARAQFNVARAQLRAEVIGAFFAILIAQERIRLAQASVDLASQGARIAGRRVEAGKISPVEATKAGVEQANAELALAEGRAALQVARDGLVSLWGNAAMPFGDVGGVLDHLPERPSIEALLQALADSPDVVASQRESDRLRAQVDVERTRRYPDVTFNVGARRNNELGLTQAVVGVSIPIPVFDRNQGNLYQALSRADQARDQQQVLAARLGFELRRASAALTVSRESAGTLRTAILPAAQQAFDAATRGFEAGKFSFLEVLDSQRTLFQARARYLDQLANAYQAAATIDRILGR
ncbi:outer membrane protein CzcC [Pigmentiphaga litoralis]|uniref:TolC family protein n=1 Tax=Pigmentiphaga litoralis TaxID=516702 RepID=UPI001675B265|nr:TolC family protein [Pigmentiphaga litoralis]GGX17093.1 outer membrane protein CzcC [Pigmentiphaga litoralis]